MENIDLNIDVLFNTKNPYGIPDKLFQEHKPESLRPYSNRCHENLQEGRFIHFFIHDVKFKGLWDKRKKTITTLIRAERCFSPDFSVYANIPKALQVFNVYRNRYLGRYLQEMGVEVVPTISWGYEDTFDFCFLGVPEGSTVAVSTLGVSKSKKQTDIFMKGFNKMIEVIKPKVIVLHGEKEIEVHEEIEVIRFNSYWGELREKGVL